MSDPEDIPGRSQPPRAQPLQPDKPIGGTSAEQPRPADGQGERAAEKQKKQSETALDNVSKGYR